MEEVTRPRGDVPFGWMLALRTWLSRRATPRRAGETGGRKGRDERRTYVPLTRTETS